MDPDEQSIKKMVLMAVGKCTECGYEYEQSSIEVVSKRGDIWLLTIACGKCHTHGLVAAIIAGQSVEAVSDLTESEKVKFHQGPSVGEDDVLDIHRFLQGFEGDFSKLF